MRGVLIRRLRSPRGQDGHDVTSSGISGRKIVHVREVKQYSITRACHVLYRGAHLFTKTNTVWSVHF